MGHVDPINNMALDRTPDSFALSNRNLWDFIGCSSSKRNFSAPILWCYCSTWDFELMLNYFGGVKADNFSRVVSDQSYFLNIDMWIKNKIVGTLEQKFHFCTLSFFYIPKKQGKDHTRVQLTKHFFPFFCHRRSDIWRIINGAWSSCTYFTLGSSPIVNIIFCWTVP